MTTKIDLFNPYSVDENALLLASHLPIGRVWQAGFSPDSNIGKFLLGLACEFFRFEYLSNLLSKEMDIRKTDQLLIEWEKSVGIPDSCFRVFSDISSRRALVEQKLAKFGGVQTAQDFENAALGLGFTVEVYYGAAGGGFSWPMTFPTVFISYADYTEESHTIVIIITGTYVSDDTFALPFPLPFGISPTQFLQCIFRKLAPANVEVIVLFP